MLDLKISEIMAMQNALQEKNKGKWDPIAPKQGRSSILWMFEEMDFEGEYKEYLHTR